jgi:hypothetical protein
VPLFAASFASAAIVATPISGVSGWNADVVYETGESSLATGTGFDSSAHDLVAQDVSGVGAGKGMPNGGAVTITNTGDQFQFQSYTASNSAQWKPNGTAGTGVTLTLATAAAYSKLSILAGSGNVAGKVIGDIIVNFTTGSPTTFTGNLNLADWVTAGNTASDAPLTGMNFYNVNTVSSASNVGLSESTIALSPADQARLVQSVTFDNGGSNGTDNVMALSGIAAPEPAALSLLAMSFVGLLGRRRATQS